MFTLIFSTPKQKGEKEAKELFSIRVFIHATMKLSRNDSHESAVKEKMNKKKKKMHPYTLHSYTDITNSISCHFVLLPPGFYYIHM